MARIVSERPAQDTFRDETTIDALLRREILAAAVEELRIWSVERFSVDTVADRAELAPVVVHRLWNGTKQLMADALVELCDLVVFAPDTGSLRSDLAGYLASLAGYVNTAAGRSLVRAAVIGPEDWAPTVRRCFWRANVDAVCVIFQRAECRNEIRPGTDRNTLLQLATGPLFLRTLYSDDPIETAQFCTQIADLVWRAVRRDDAALEPLAGQRDSLGQSEYPSRDDVALNLRRAT